MRRTGETVISRRCTSCKDASKLLVLALHRLTVTAAGVYRPLLYRHRSKPLEPMMRYWARARQAVHIYTRAWAQVGVVWTHLNVCYLHQSGRWTGTHSSTVFSPEDGHSTLLHNVGFFTKESTRRSNPKEYHQNSSTDLSIVTLK
jgi:hypothetical protein